MHILRRGSRIALVRNLTAGAAQVIRKCWMPVMELMYPPVCAACDALCEGGDVLCDTCRGQLDAMAHEAACECCGGPMPPGVVNCPWCRGRGRPLLDSVVRLGLYEQPLSTLINRMKYNGRWPLAEYLAGRLLRMPAVGRLLERSDCILAVPLHIRRQMSRGYNQSEVVASCLARASGKPLVRAAKRVRDTHSQTSLRSREARHENVRGAFRLTDGSAVAGRRVVLVDDVLTTGATVCEMARTLKPARPAAMAAIVMCISDPRHAGSNA